MNLEESKTCFIQKKRRSRWYWSDTNLPALFLTNQTSSLFSENTNYRYQSSLSHQIDISDSKYISYQHLGIIPIEWRLRLSLTDPVTEETVSLLSVLRDCHYPGRGLVIRVSSEVEVKLSVCS